MDDAIFIPPTDTIVPIVIIYPPIGPSILMAASATGVADPAKPLPNTPILIPSISIYIIDTTNITITNALGTFFLGFSISFAATAKDSNPVKA